MAKAKSDTGERTDAEETVDEQAAAAADAPPPEPIAFDAVAGAANELDAAVVPLNAGHTITTEEAAVLAQAVAGVRALAPLPEPEPGTIERDIDQELADEAQVSIDAQQEALEAAQAAEADAVEAAEKEAAEAAEAEEAATADA